MAREPGQLPSPTAALANYLDLEQLLSRVAAYAAESSEAERINILLHDRDAQEFLVAAAWGTDGQAPRGARLPDTAGAAAAALRSGEARLVSGRELADGPLSDHDRHPPDRTRSLMVAPLMFDHRVLGVVEAANRQDGAPFDAADLERFTSGCGLIAVALENASLYRGLHLETERLKRFQDDRAQPLLAESPAMRAALAQADRAAMGRSTVLLVGETGTGKEQIARRIHDASPRAKKPFVALNCGALPETL